MSNVSTIKDLLLTNLWHIDFNASLLSLAEQS